jgi:Protein of unknown function (DUF3987)/Bifunctional DNA primase/polymerase, N-terminal
MTALLQVAKNYVARGWNPLPLPFKSKVPIDEGWPERVIGEADLPKYFNGQPQNIGVVLGPTSNDLTDVDLDCPEAITLAPQALPTTDAIFGRTSAPASHWLYRTKLASSSEDEKATFQFKDPTRPTDDAMILEVRVGGFKGAQTVFPGSVHESDEEIRWDATGNEAEIAGNDLLNRARLLASICLFARYWPCSGARHDAALSLGGFLARAGLKTPTIKYLVEAIARTAGDNEPRDRRDTAEDAAQEFYAGRPARGYPLLSKTFGDEIAKQVAKWLDFHGSYSDDGNGITPSTGGQIEPVDLWGKFEPPPLPRALLPRVIEDFAFERSAVMGCDISSLAVGALVVCAAAIPQTIKLQPKKNDTEWQETARLWVMEVGDPSTMKTPGILATTKPLKRIDDELASDYQKALESWTRLPKEDQKKTPKPKKLRAMIFNTTIESVQEILKDSPNGVLLEDDELSGWSDAMYKYSGTRGAQTDRAFWMKAYNGGSHTVDRITRGQTHIPHLSVSILGGVQPGPISKLANAGDDDGLMQRFIPIMARPAKLGHDQAPEDAVTSYARLIEDLRELKPPPNAGYVFPPTVPLTFDAGGLKIRQQLELKHLEFAGIEGLNRKLTAHLGKYNGIFARLCVIFHCIEHCARKDRYGARIKSELPSIVTTDTAQRVAEFLHSFLLPHALAFYGGVLGLANDHDRLANVADYILAHGLEHVTNRSARRPDHAQTGTGPNHRDLRAARSARLGRYRAIAAPRLSTTLGGQSARAPEIRRAGQGIQGTPRTRPRNGQGDLGDHQKQNNNHLTVPVSRMSISAQYTEMSRSLLNIAKRPLPRLTLRGVGLTSKDAVS